MAYFEVDVCVRDMETGEVARKIMSKHIELGSKQKLEIWVNGHLKYEDEVHRDSRLGKLIEDED